MCGLRLIELVSWQPSGALVRPGSAIALRRARSRRCALHALRLVVLCRPVEERTADISVVSECSKRERSRARLVLSQYIRLRRREPLASRYDAP